MIVVEEEQIRNAVSVADLLPSQSEALRAYSAGGTSVPPVGVIALPAGDAHIKSAYLAGGEHFAIKVVSAFPASERGAATSDGFIAVCSATSGRIVALLADGGWLTDARTAAAGVLATQTLARADASSLTVLGAGVQAGLQVRALAAARPLDQITVWARNPLRLDAFVGRLAGDLPRVTVMGAATARQAVDAADIIVTATSSNTPVLHGAWLRPGQHVTAVGGDDPHRAELDAEALRRADRLIVDSRAQNLVLADVARAIGDGQLSASDIHGELGEVLLGRIPGRRGPQDITIAKLTGIGAQDLTAATATLRLLDRIERTGATQR